MKRVLFIIAMIATSLSSCKKEYSCVCTANGTEYSSSTIKATKKKAEEECNRDDSEISLFGVELVIECSI